jgi:uncharacterized cupin superfamily protein
VNKVNVLTVELDDSLDEAGFRNDATSIGARLGARRMGAGVYEAVEDVPIWPYHYHYGVEEWLYVIAGAPVLREPAGERALAAGDLVCFPEGHAGAHTIKGPGRFVIFDAGRDAEPFGSVYPDSDKVSGPFGMLLRSSAVGYWHNEGTAGPSEPVEPRREPATGPARPTVNALTAATGSLDLGGHRLAATIADGSEPYRYVHGREAWIVVLDGTPTLRHPDGEDVLEPGDVVCLPDGPAGAHQLLDHGRALILSTTGVPANVFYPDTERWEMING